MLRQDYSRIDPDDDGINNEDEYSETGSASVDIQRELNQLEEMILDSPRVPFTGRTLVDEEKLLDQLDIVRLNLPQALREAETVIAYKDEIFRQAEDYGQEIIQEAERRAAQIVNEIGIIRQAEREAQLIRQRVQEECDALQAQTLAEIDRMRQQAKQELEEMRQRILADCEDIQMGADEYADQVLGNIEQQLADMMRVIRNGRQQLHIDTTPVRIREIEGGSSSPRALPNLPKKN